MKKAILYILLLSQTTLLSCSKWLDVQPESDIDRDILFTTEEGFKEALLGIYTRNAKTDLYGKELTIGTTEVLAQNYKIKPFDRPKYLATKNYRYDDADFMQRKDAIWLGLYSGIVNANLILAEIDQKQNLFTAGNYALIKGETLALRGYLHFDALRLFAPAYLVNPEAAAIPYVTSYSNKTTAMSKVKDVLDSVIADLEQAKELLTDDPIRKSSYIIGYPSADTLTNTELHDKSLFLQNRRHRLNFYAVCGALARVYLYKGDKTNALANAKIVIDAKKFPWTNKTDFLQPDADKKDRILYKELLFGWYIPSLNNEINISTFSDPAVDGIYLSDDDVKSIYETGGAGGSDMRFTQWFSGLNGTEKTIQKYRRNPVGDTFIANKHYLMAPALRLSEVYYIAAECTYEADPDAALAYLDEVRLHREIGDKVKAANLSEFQTELLKEYRKETYAEGQLFYAYKRLNKPIIGFQGEIIPASQRIFVLPLPDDEIIYGER
ncbi:RagB/SusD family nutrient uptake outer membrane protein [Sphingobacterium olei]|uniref:RagB/SusD family nutrient uptake outer membrane protein n=1 Tax=Sphingobacterium olei TaxID=2571155 RepID=A0A4V5MN37_9SPHI|nr:RagB/SusD family nutrient uptake outer membrane protein [Sphingobacterium olei]TJZ63238.1 RagB/SusD family nutrient uptake outer membrane protein [Sphingobacterium olei]